MKNKKSKTILWAAAALVFAGVAGFEMCCVLHDFFVERQELCGFRARAAAAVRGEEDTVIRAGDVNSTKTAITCNVDWGEDALPSMLHTLKEKDIKITFFVSGKWAAKNPGLLRRMFLAGHEIQSHGYSHKLCTRISEEEARREIEKTQEVIYNLIGVRPTVFAPPSGDYDAGTVRLCRDLHYKLSLWSADTIDWRPGSTADIIKSRVLKKDLHGGIILMHPKPETAKALGGLIDEVEKQGLRIVPLCELGVM